MKRNLAFFSLLALLISIVFVLAAGCNSLSNDALSPTASPTTVMPPVVTTMPVTPAPSQLPTTVPPTIPPTVRITSDDVTQHFMDLSFGGGNSQLQRLPFYGPNTKNSVAFDSGGGADMDTVLGLIRDFNELSQTNQFQTNFKGGSAGDIVIKFIPQAGMAAIPMDPSLREYKSGGVSLAKISPSTIYINADLKSSQRDHVIARSFLYELGFRGESLMYPDSVFYYADNTNTKLTLIDKKAIQIMYGPGLRPGMNVSEVRGVVYVRGY